MLASFTMRMVAMRVWPVWKASAIISNWMSSSSPKSSGAPSGALGRLPSESALADSFCTRISTSRTDSR